MPSRIRTAAAALAVLTAGAAAACGKPPAAPPGGGGPGAPAVHGSGFGSSWTTYHGDARSSGVDAAGTRLLPLRPAWVSPVLDGELYGEPLVAAGRVVVATENDTVDALAADTGRVLWQRHLGPPVPARLLQCGDIGPQIGITGTPVVDPARGEIFAVADELRGARAAHHLVGLDLRTGRVELDQVVDPAGSDPLAQLQRTALALDRGEVVFGFGGNAGDCGRYHGFVVAVPEAGGPLRTYEVDAGPGESRGAVWMGGAAPVVDPAGNLWVATGNGSAVSPTDPYDGSDSVVELSPALRLEQRFSPVRWRRDNATDTDLGSTSPALVGGLVVIAGKGSEVYLLRAGRLGGIGGDLAALDFCPGSKPTGGDAVFGTTVYVGCESGLVALAVHASPPALAVRWQTSTGAGGPPIVAGGLVWTIDQHGVLWGLDPGSGGAVVHEPLGGVANHFPTPAVGDGLLLAAGVDQVHAFTGPAGLPPAP